MRDNSNSHGLNFQFINFRAIAARMTVFGLLIVAYLAAGPVPSSLARDSATMKCTASQDRVWVYESLGSFDVSAKLPCGATVEIVSRVKGFVKIHAANGVEGYVPDSAFANLPPLEDDSNKPVATVSSLAAVAARARAHVAAEEAVSAAEAVPAPPTIVASKATPSVANAAPIAKAAARATSASATVATTAPAVSKTSVAPVEVVLSTSPESSNAPTNAPSIAPTPMKPAAPAIRRTAAATVASASRSSASKAKASQPPATGSNAHNYAAPSPAPAPPPDVTSSKPAESTANLQQSRNIASIHPVAAVVESEDFPDSQPQSESGDPACQIFFSAYGITPAQAKWIAQNRKKRFSSVCPAAGPSQVDFVMIFSHDTDFYGTTMPSLVHTDQNGFSDFSPLTMIDSAVIPLSEADKARREYVWVFQMKRGSFDPGKFSPRRRYQFTKSEANSLTASHASARTVEDAFHFMEEQGPTR